ncbi:carbohydrate ABC transporter permease [Bogoriella caseilytica]|uniref:Multiple sugar transport system permease protein n=1 Tax=Bogoriella caseilytica TaxID=56055 RepID=A0A3N2BAF9_9MICO|nr:sugar ABC transporter permease [Bogoriella caseilytica]ROR72256.1 multiple sugar transport system permease protein [Bogoriella caseilytica]
MTTGAALGSRTTAGPGHRRALRGSTGWQGWGWIFVLPGLVGLVVFVVTPMVASLVLGFFDATLLGGLTPVGLDNFSRMVGDRQFLNSVVVTTLFVLIFVPLNIALSTAMALWLRTRLAGRSWLRVIFLIPALSPMVANAAVFRMLLQRDGLFNSVLDAVGLGAIPWLSEGRWALAAIILVSVWQTFGYNMIIIGAGLDSVNPDVISASRIDGAGALRRLWSITIPLTSPALFFATVMTVIGAWQTFAQSYIITGGGPGDSTTTIMLYLYRTAFSYNQLGYASAISAALFLIIATVTLIQVWGQKKWVHYDG